MSLSQTETEIQCVVHWFKGWSPMQKGDFLKDLVEKALPNMNTLFDAMGVLEMADKPPSIFKCQMKLFDQWFRGWTDSERGIGVFCWKFTSPTEEEMRKRLKGSPSSQRAESEKLYGKQKENKILFDALKKSAGITDEDINKK